MYLDITPSCHRENQQEKCIDSEIWTNHHMQGTKLGNMIDQTWVLPSRPCSLLRKLKLKNLYLFFYSTHLY